MSNKTNKLVSVLIVDDDHSVTASIALLLKQNGINALTAANPESAIEILENSAVDLILQDMNFSRNTSGEEGMQLLKSIKQQTPHVPVILMTAWGSIELAVEGIKQGAADFMTKPWSNQQLLKTIKTSLELHQVNQSPPIGRAELDQAFNFSSIIGNDPAMLEMLSTIGRVASTDAPVLILGESGTGKELVAEAIHQNSHRKQGPLVKLNLGGMSASLFESEMFGHVRGAFTDAKQDRKGRFEVADSGSIFLDEMGDLEPSSQVKLLRVLQDQSFQPVGSSETRRANVRVISATNRNLHEMVGDGSFREDLLYRLNLITIRIPPLRNRRGDIRLLAESHLQKVSEIYNVPLVSIDESGMSWLEQQSWPGNVRQLAQTIERAVLMSNQAQLSINDFQTERGHPAQSTQTELPVGSMTLDEMEKLMIEKAIKAYNRNLSKVAQALGISRAALYRRIEKYGLNS